MILAYEYISTGQLLCPTCAEEMFPGIIDEPDAFPGINKYTAQQIGSRTLTCDECDAPIKEHSSPREQIHAVAEQLQEAAELMQAPNEVNRRSDLPKKEMQKRRKANKSARKARRNNR